MMLGKRGRRPPMKRTTSMTEFTIDFNGVVNNDTNLITNHQEDQSRFNAHPQPSDPKNNFNGVDHDRSWYNNSTNYTIMSSHRLPQRRNSGDFAVETAQFLRVCSLCKHRLIPGHDIYMYRGDTAFCSLECRQHQMIQDEIRKDKKCSLAAYKKEAVVVTAAIAPTVQPVSTAAAAGETVTAV